MPTLIVKRNNPWGARFRQMTILVDGEKVAQVGYRGQVSINLAPGAHEVVAKMDWVSSRPVSITVADGEIVQLITAYKFGNKINLDRITGPEPFGPPGTRA